MSFAEESFLGNQRVPQLIRQRVAQVLRPANYDQLRAELTDIADFLIDRQLIQERVFGRPGDLVRVVGGPFLGTEGVIRKLRPTNAPSSSKFRFLGTRVEVSVDEWLVSRI